MALKRHLWYTDLVLATFERSGNQLIGFVMANYAYQPNYRSLGQPHGLEEAPAVHRPGLGHLGKFFLAELVHTMTLFNP